MTDKNVRPIWSDEDLDRALGALRVEEAGEPGLVQSRIVLLEKAGRTRRWGWGGSLAAAAAVLAMIAGAVVVQQAVSADGPDPSGVGTEARERLMAAAAKIATPGPARAAGQYSYVLVKQRRLFVEQSKDYKPSVTPMMTTPPPGTYITPEPGDFATSTTDKRRVDSELWAPARWTDVWRQTITFRSVKYPSNGPEKPYGRPEVRSTDRRCGYWGSVPFTCRTDSLGKQTWDRPTPEFLASLPRDPEQMYAMFRKEAEPLYEWGSAMLGMITFALEQPGIPADVQRTLLQTIALLPNLRVAENATDESGRVGTAFGLGDHYSWEDIIVDEKTGTYLGRQVVSKVETAYSGHAGTVVERVAFHQAIVDRIGQRP